MNDLTGWTLFGWALSSSLIEVRFFDFRPNGSLMRNAVVVLSGPSVVQFDRIQDPGAAAENHRVVIITVNDSGHGKAGLAATLANGGTIKVEAKAATQVIW